MAFYNRKSWSKRRRIRIFNCGKSRESQESGKNRRNQGNWDCLGRKEARSD